MGSFRPDSSPDGWHWIKLGSNPAYVAIVAGHVEAVAYESGALAAEDEQRIPLVGQLGWFWFPADEADVHRELELGGLPSERETTLEPAHGAALEVAAESINRHFGLLDDQRGEAGRGRSGCI